MPAVLANNLDHALRRQRFARLLFSEHLQDIFGLLLRAAAIVGALGLLLAAFWLIPFMTKGSWMAQYGELWKSLPTMLREIWHGGLFAHVAPLIVWLAMVGGIIAIWRRQLAGIFVAWRPTPTLRGPTPPP